MQDIHIFRNQDLVLKVNPTYDPTKLRLKEWDSFLDKLCGDRDYQKEAIKQVIIFMVGGKYKKIEDLAEENYKNNPELQIKYSSLEDYLHKLQIQGKLFANIDLATGTGKSYVMYGIAQIMLGLGVVDRVLLLCPSLTIEAGLKEKFESLSGNQQLKDAIPENSIIKNPRIIDANQTIKSGDICIENIHAVYEKTGSSIQDSLKGTGSNVLVLNDESHHIFNKSSDKDVKKWKEFLTNDDFGFQYIVGFTGTAYIDNNYFNDVIYRFSLREAIENKFVKSIEYVAKDDSIGKGEKFQKIHQNHIDNIDRYPKIKPLTILITADIEKAEELKDDLVEFLMQKENKSKEQIEEKVLIITSHKDHKSNLLKLKTVDSKENKTEWIISVSMLSEGWDVKNVFQIVPWEDRAFNSKLLISQVLGRGLRVPPEYELPQPKVIVFNHDAWSRNIIELVNEVLEIEKRVVSEVLDSGDRSKYNFEVFNLDYSKEEVEVELETKESVMNFSRIFNEGIKLEAQVEEIEKGTVFESLGGTQSQREKNYLIEYATTSVDDIVDKIYSEFEMRDWEGKVLQLNQEQYTQNNLPPRTVIKEIIIKSMQKLGIKGERLIEKNKNHILSGFGTLLRKKNKTVITKLKVNDPILIKTIEVDRESLGIGNFRKDCTVFLTTNYLQEVNEEQGAILSELSEDESLPRSAIKEQNEYLFKTPLNVILTKGEPERKFIEGLCKQDVVEKINCWIKSRDRGFYGIEYSLRYGDKGSNTRRYTNKKFNPDFFIQIQKEDIKYTLVIETKMDGDDSEENKAKYKYALEHFNRLNEELEQRGINEKYIFHFLSPQGYSTFFEYLKDGRILEGQEKYRCALENSLENNEEEL
ncbi:MAG: DEAD/DEAH box helicase family protein [Candidatus Altimarinota bacterium]